MSIENSNSGCSNVQTLVNQLLEKVNQIDKDDLSGLAQMHGWCEELAEAAGAENLPAEIGKQTISLVNALEQLILGNATDADTTVASVIESVSNLATLVTSSAQEDLTPTDSKSDAEAKLEQIFDEEPDSSEAAETADTSDSEAQQDNNDEPAYESIPLTIDKSELEFVKGFVEEAGEHIEAVESTVLEVEQAPEDMSKIDDLFRPFHTIKGMAGFLNLRDINRLTHEVETLLDKGRKGQRPITPGIIDLVFEVVDILKVQILAIAAYVADPQGGTIPQPPVAEMIGRLQDVVAGRLEPEGREPASGIPSQKVGENLVDQGSVPKEVVDFALDTQKQTLSDKKVGEILVDMKATTPKQVSQAIRAQTPTSTATSTSKKTVGDQSIRIETGKLDSLIDMVGELVIAQTLVNGNTQIAQNAKLNKDVSQVCKIVRDVQEVAMAMRMIPIGPTFQKMARLVRDVSRKANKKVNLAISGEDTELDKNVIQQISDPLVHMVRNAVDHGVESPDARQAAGKNPTGQVHLNAFHAGGNIVIEVHDDGNGLDPEVLIAKGIEKGLVQPDEDLNEQQAYALLFAPGFSTAKQVTDISGRGVGMDVVKRNIEALRGKVDITSKKGQGTTFSIRLPLTLAIIDGMVVRVGKERFIIPTIDIEQSLRPTPDQITSVQHRGEVLNLRGRIIPLLQLGRIFGLSGRVDPCEAMVVIAQSDSGSVGLVIEDLLGQQQVVIKTLGERFKKLQGISGAAILGDGQVGLILETSGIATEYQEHFCSTEYVASHEGEANKRTKDVPGSNENEQEDSGLSARVEPEPALT